MRTNRAPYQVVRGFDVGHPVPDRLIDGVFERARPGLYCNHFRAQKTHAVNVERLPDGVLHSHVHNALEAQHRAHGGGGNAMLPGARFRNDALFTHPLRQQALPQRVVDLVRSGVRQVLAF